VRAFACYGYHAHVGLAAGELYQRPGRTVAAFPTNDDQGITSALRDADRLASDIIAGYDRGPLDRALAGHGLRRDRELSGMYDATVELARFRPPSVGQRLLFSSLRDQPAEISRFLGAFAGITPIDAYLSGPNALRVIARSWHSRRLAGAALG
jgi:hypothetical protein